MVVVYFGKVSVMVNVTTFKNKKIQFLLLILVTTIVAILSGAVNWTFQFVVIGSIYFFGSYLILRFFEINRNFKIISLILPFTLIYGMVAFLNPNFNLATLPLIFMPLMASIIAFFFYDKKHLILIISLLFPIVSFLIIENWLVYVEHRENPIKIKTFPQLIIENETGNNFVPQKGNVYVFELWSTGCPSCIKKLGEFQMLNEKFKKFENIEFYALNLPQFRDSEKRINAVTSASNLNFLFTKEMAAWQKLDLNYVPKLLILDKSLQYVYFGSLNTKWYIFFNNSNKIISNLLNEN